MSAGVLIQFSTFQKQRSFDGGTQLSRGAHLKNAK